MAPGREKYTDTVQIVKSDLPASQLPRTYTPGGDATVVCKVPFHLEQEDLKKSSWHWWSVLHPRHWCKKVVLEFIPTTQRLEVKVWARKSGVNHALEYKDIPLVWTIPE